VGALLFVGAYLLNAATLEDLALALFVGILVGTYSSVFIASPVLALWKEREPKYQARTARIGARTATRTPAVATAGPAASDMAASDVHEVEEQPRQRPAPRPGPRPTPRGRKRRGGKRRR
jgi:preprotein translocase subunit SecF